METKERTIYRMNCKYYGEYNDSCYWKSGGGNGFFIDIACTPNSKCPRMMRYDKLHKKIKTMKQNYK